MGIQAEGNDSVVSEINIVPFVDVVLVILIIFLVISPTFIKPGFDVNLPVAETAKKPENVKVILSIDIEGLFYINQKPVKRTELSERLKKMAEKDKDMKAVIAADKDVAHGNVMALIDLARKAGLNKFAVSVESGK